MKFRILTLILVSLSLFAQGQEKSFSLSPFEYRRDLEKVATSEGLGHIQLDGEVFEHTGESWEDIRLVKIDPDGSVEWPYRIERSSAGVVKTPSRLIKSETVSFDEQPDGAIELVVELTAKDLEATKLRINTPLRDFEKAVTIQGSADGKDWVALVDGALIFDRERYIDFRRAELALPQNNYRFFKVVIDQATDEQWSSVRNVTEAMSDLSGPSKEESSQVATRRFRIDSLAFYTAPVSHDPGRGEQVYPVAISSVMENEEAKQTEIYVEAGRAPLHGLTLRTSDRNFRRSIRLEVERGENQWRTLKKSTVYRYRIGTIDEQNLTLRFDEHRAARYRLVIENGDSPSLVVDEVEGRGPAYEVQFLTEPGDQFEMYYGAIAGSVERPRYDVAVLERVGRQEVAGESFQLGTAVLNEAFRQDAGPKKSFFEQGWVLWGGIALVVVVLMRVLYGTAKRIEKVSD